MPTKEYWQETLRRADADNQKMGESPTEPGMKRSWEARLAYHQAQITQAKVALDKLRG
jgi:hypothetical protein